MMIGETDTIGKEVGSAFMGSVVGFDDLSGEIWAECAKVGKAVG